MPTKAAKIFYQHQRDFNYLEIRHLWEDAKVDASGIHIAGMHYNALILDSLSYIPEKAIPFLETLAANGKLIVWRDSQYSAMLKGARVINSDEEMVAAVDILITPDIILNPSSENIRYRHVEKDGDHYYILFNEEESTVTTNLELSVQGKCWWLNPYSAEVSEVSSNNSLLLKPHELKVLWIDTNN